MKNFVLQFSAESSQQVVVPDDLEQQIKQLAQLKSDVEDVGVNVENEEIEQISQQIDKQLEVTQQLDKIAQTLQASEDSKTPLSKSAMQAVQLAVESIYDNTEIERPHVLSIEAYNDTNTRNAYITYSREGVVETGKAAWKKLIELIDKLFAFVKQQWNNLNSKIMRNKKVVDKVKPVVAKMDEHKPAMTDEDFRGKYGKYSSTFILEKGVLSIRSHNIVFFHLIKDILKETLGDFIPELSDKVIHILQEVPDKGSSAIVPRRLDQNETGREQEIYKEIVDLIYKFMEKNSKNSNIPLNARELKNSKTIAFEEHLHKSLDSTVYYFELYEAHPGEGVWVLENFKLKRGMMANLPLSEKEPSFQNLLSKDFLSSLIEMHKFIEKTYPSLKTWEDKLSDLYDKIKKRRYDERKDYDIFLKRKENIWDRSTDTKDYRPEVFEQALRWIKVHIQMLSGLSRMCNQVSSDITDYLESVVLAELTSKQE